MGGGVGANPDTRGPVEGEEITTTTDMECSVPGELTTMYRSTTTGEPHRLYEWCYDRSNYYFSRGTEDAPTRPRPVEGTRADDRRIFYQISILYLYDNRNASNTSHSNNDIFYNYNEDTTSPIKDNYTTSNGYTNIPIY